MPRVSQGFAVGESQRPAGALARHRRHDAGHRGRRRGRQPPGRLHASTPRIDQNDSRAEQTPARVGEGYLYFCLVGQDTDIGLVRVEIAGKDRFKLTQSGTVMEPTAKGLKSTRSTNPAEHFTCIEGTVDANLATDHVHRPRRARDRAAGLA